MIDVISTCVSGLVVFSEAWVMVVLFHVGQSNFWVPIEALFSIISVDTIASEPLIESHCAHDVVIRHRVKTVKGVLDFLLRSNSRLETGCSPSRWKAFPIHNLLVFKSPGLECQHVNIFRLDELIFNINFVEVEYLRSFDDVLC